ncbi:hypothetical protein ADEAN_000194000 [Angomonas deanei]|uniref:Uncharacterized protein n=1 Tax=Angomonas deanei TaxID=59799 RepID=A0A7G2C6V5_9TRYP|nr:hypothetical protein ADEAN_000194000 [Angomonas deanei]
MTDTVPAAFFAQWVALQGRVDDLTNEKMAWVKEESVLREENRELREKYDQLNKVHDALVEEHQNYMEEMINLNTRLKQELEEAKDMRFKMGEVKKVLMEKFYNYSTGQFDLIALFNYCRTHSVPTDVIKDALSEDGRETLSLPNDLNSLVGHAHVKQFLEAIVAALPNLKCITGYFTSIHHCYLQHKEGNVPRKVLEAYCAGYNRTTYQLTQDEVNTIQSAALSVSDYLTTVLPLLPQVTDLFLPDNLGSLVGEVNVKEVLEAIVASLPNLKCITGYFTSIHHCYLQHKQGNVPRKVLEAYCAGYNESDYTVTQDIRNDLQLAELSVSEYLRTVVPLLSKVTGLSLPDDLNTLLGNANVKEFLEAIVASLPNLKSVTGYFTSIHHCYLQHKEGIVPRKVLEAYCGGYNRTTYQLTNDAINTIQSAGLSVSEYLSTVLPLLPEVTDVSLYKTKITTLDWCERLPERVSMVDISGCPKIKDYTPLLKMKGLKDVYYNGFAHSSFQRVKEQLTGRGVKYTLH